MDDTKGVQFKAYLLQRSIIETCLKLDISPSVAGFSLCQFGVIDAVLRGLSKEEYIGLVNMTIETCWDIIVETNEDVDHEEKADAVNEILNMLKNNKHE